ncbi:hypothetical protein ABW19_dt0200247 [Dactylella cylindrospora]|nr:hypothetical protein ABW19_dt0200247 [Dactylella cylindrospora]
MRQEYLEDVQLQAGLGGDIDSTHKSSIDKTVLGPNSPDTPNKFVYYARKVYHPIGFKRGYNFVLFFIFAGAMLGFSLARTPYINVTGSSPTSFASSALPTEWYWYSQGHYRIGITLHLVTIIPAGILMGFQFLPIIRYKALLVHRINGYLIIILVTVANVGALMIARRAFGGGVETQAAVGVLVIMTTTSMSLAYYNIKKLQIEQHRKWMLRAMFYLGVIITLRIIMVIAATVVDEQESYYTAVDCGEIKYGYYQTQDNATEAERLFAERWPTCLSTDPKATANGHVAVQGLPSGGLEKVIVGYKVTFGMAAWLALLIHLVGVEVYLALTPREDERLRRVSYERQMERGWKMPGREGLTADRVGDAELWRPPVKG